VATLGTAEAGGLCAVLRGATGASNCSVTGTSAAARRHLLAAGGVVVAYTVQTTPAAASNVTNALLTSAVLSSAASFRAVGLVACTSAVPSAVTPTSSLVPPVASTTLPVTAFATSTAWSAHPRFAGLMLACLACAL